MVLRVLFSAALLILLVGLPGVAAQFAILAEGPAEPAALLVGTEGKANVTVRMQSTAQSQFVCGQTSQITVTLTLSGTAPELGLNATISPQSLTFAIPQGVYVGGVTPQWNADVQTAIVTVQLGNNVPPGHGEHAYKVAAEYGGEAPAGCQSPGGQWTGATDEAEVPVTPRFPPGSPGGPTPTGGGTGGGGAGASPTDKAKESPALAPLLWLSALGAVVLLRRR